MNEKRYPSYSWGDISSKLGELVAVDGGYTRATRGIIRQDDGTNIFIKQGVDDDTRRWAEKEIEVYRFLELNSYPHIPTLLSVNPDKTGFALSACLPEDGWKWQGGWNQQRLERTLEVMDALAALVPDGKFLDLFSERVVSGSDEGWLPLLNSEELQLNLMRKVEKAGARVDIKKESLKADFAFQYTHLVHNDIRADNCAWNEGQNRVCLVDWNWAQMGDRRIDVAATLVDVFYGGFDISPFYKRIDSSALHWLAGYWLKSASTPGPEKVREFQLKSGLTALKLVDQIEG